MNKTTAAAPCELCETTEFETVAQRDRRGEPLHTVICRRCGLLRHEHLPSDETLRAFYESAYREDYHGESKPSDRRVMRAWNSAERLYGRLHDRIAQNARVLEVGAGIGCTVKRFAQAGFDAWGVEPHRGFCNYGRRELEAKLNNQSLSDITAQEDHDLVLLIHVIEHFNHPLKALRELAGLIRPDGWLYVECPNLAAPFARKSKMFHFAHVHNFTKTTLTAMASRVGFTPVVSFTSERSPNIEILFQRRGEPVFAVDPAGYRESRNALRRATGLRYVLRRDYWALRAERLGAYAKEFLAATSLVSRLRSKSRNAPPATPTTEVTPRPGLSRRLV